MKKILVSLLFATIIIASIDFLGSFALGGLATVKGIPIPYYNNNYETGEVFKSIWYLILDFFVWFLISLGIVHLFAPKKKNES